jgi:hypothetical protein
LKQTCEALSEFIYREQFEQFVRIIHGKGYRSDNKMSVLKTQVVNFLQQHPQVLAFHSFKGIMCIKIKLWHYSLIPCCFNKANIAPVPPSLGGQE